MSAIPTAISASGMRATARPTSRRSPSSSQPPTGPMPKPRKSVTPRKIARATSPSPTSSRVWRAPRAGGGRLRARVAGRGRRVRGASWVPMAGLLDAGRGARCARIPPGGDTPPAGAFLPAPAVREAVRAG